MQGMESAIYTQSVQRRHTKKRRGEQEKIKTGASSLCQ